MFDDTELVTTLIAWLKEDFGGIDIMNAGNQAYDDAVETFETIYYGVNRVTQEFFPLFRESPAGARTSMITSQLGLLQDQLSDVEHLIESVIDKVVAKYLSDVKEGQLKEEGWASNCEQYNESKPMGTALRSIPGAFTGFSSLDLPVSVNAI